MIEFEATERGTRRPGFTQGPEFVGPDGSLWILPVLEEKHYDEMPAIKEYFRVSDSQGFANDASPFDSNSQFQVIARLSIELLNANYFLTIDDIVTITFGIASGKCTAPFHLTLKNFRALFHVYNASNFAEKFGLDRAEQVEWAKNHIVTSSPLVGFTRHDKMMFDN
jgi:hypothetical protein